MATPGSKLKSPEASTPMFGCEHLQRLFTQNHEVMNNAISHYKETLCCIFDRNPMVSRTGKFLDDGGLFTSLTPTYLCLQCVIILAEEDMVKHATKKQHRFYVESQTGTLFCQLCDDMVYDPTLEDLRVRKSNSGRFSSHTLKPQLLDESQTNDPLLESLRIDARQVASNTMPPPCRANGLRGIYNAGATCYQNVILQSFIHNPILRNFYLSDGHRASDCPNEHCISCAIDELFQEFYAYEITNGYTAANVLSSFWISEKKAFENLVTTKEQDAHEFFQFLAEELHERNKTAGQADDVGGGEHSCNCVIHYTFYGKLQSTTTCQNCKGVTNATESFLDLNLGLEQLVQKRARARASTSTGSSSDAGADVLTLQDCLEEEYVKSANCEYRCHNCSSTQQAKRQTSIKTLPNVLAIQLKRFEYKQNRHDKACKINTPVRFPLELGMIPYTELGKELLQHQSHSDGKQNQQSDSISPHYYELSRSCQYELLAVVVHCGEIDSGHYIVYCRVDEQWFSFNDHRIELANLSDVLRSQAYLLFYCTKALS